MTIKEKFTKWINLDIRKVAIQTLEDNEQEYLRIQKQQMYKGEDAIDGIMNQYKWDSYADKKSSMNSKPPYGVRDNYLTGDFYSGFYLKADGNSFTVGSMDSKEEIIEKQSGGSIFGLNTESTKEFKPTFQKGFISKVKDATS